MLDQGPRKTTWVNKQRITTIVMMMTTTSPNASLTIISGNVKVMALLQREHTELEATVLQKVWMGLAAEKRMSCRHINQTQSDRLYDFFCS